MCANTAIERLLTTKQFCQQNMTNGSILAKIKLNIYPLLRISMRAPSLILINMA